MRGTRQLDLAIGLVINRTEPKRWFGLEFFFQTNNQIGSGVFF